MKPRHVRFAALLALTLPTLAFAHPGHDSGSGFASGFAHPFSGVDHIALFVVAGTLAALIRGPGRWSLLAGVLALVSLAHRDWILPGADGAGFSAGFVVASALLIGAGLGVVRMIQRRVIARARRTGL